MNDQIIKALNWRYATKVYDTSKPLAEKDLMTILESARLAPSSVGVEPWKFVVVENKELRAKLQEAAYGQPKVTEAPYVVVLTRRTDIRENIKTEALERTSKTVGEPLEQLNGYKSMLDGAVDYKDDVALAAWAAAQTYIALGMMVETAALLEIDACPMEGFNPAAFDEILGLREKNLAAVSMITFGYRGEDDYAQRPKVRRAFDEVVEFIK